jgi:antitoxin (DNA-binding transcriptional repressor) of toxin-antitoxin stability system
MSNMKTTTVRDVQHNLRKILQWIEDGEVVTVTRHKRVVANIVPSTPAVRRTAWPDFAGRLTDIWGKGPKGKSASKTIIDERNERP